MCGTRRLFRLRSVFLFFFNRHSYISGNGATSHVACSSSPMPAPVPASVSPTRDASLRGTLWALPDNTLRNVNMCQS